MRILESTQQNGEPFKAGNGLSQVILVGAVSGEDYTLMVRIDEGSAWVDTDVSFSGDGIQTSYTNKDFEYRMSTTATGVGAAAEYILIGLR